ncbi:hypothetical protein RAS1_28030 [Phycisphaerae bacterium RAS1]|nr:hypothetical protein RAS1_28030 [Phycisphaerae bacterium RAS1]
MCLITYTYDQLGNRLGRFDAASGKSTVYWYDVQADAVPPSAADPPPGRAAAV